MGTIKINDMTFEGDAVIVENGKITIDGKVIEGNFKGAEVIVSDIQLIVSDGSVVLKGEKCCD